MHRAWRAGSVVLVAALTLGCGGEPAAAPNAPVKGKVTLDGQALTGGNVTFQSQTPPPAGMQANMSAGQINSSGEFEIFTAGKSGAPVGKYKVSVTPSMVPGGTGAAEIPMKYRDLNQTPFEFEVVEKADPGRYDLKLEK
jgi:hypothetical protein